jgi:hypothetical protein
MKRVVWLRWWFMVSVMVLASVALYLQGIFGAVNTADFTKISFAIYGLFILMTAQCGYNTYRACPKTQISDKEIESITRNTEIGWFISDALLTMGMIGTVLGFIFMLKMSFADFKDVTQIQNVLSTMGMGMTTALYTTAAGLICSLLLKVQLFNLAQHLDKFVAVADKDKKTYCTICDEK